MKQTRRKILLYSRSILVYNE